MWDLWWTHWHWDRNFCFLLSVSFRQPCPLTFHSSITDAIRPSLLTTSLNKILLRRIRRCIRLQAVWFKVLTFDACYVTPRTGTVTIRRCIRLQAVWFKVLTFDACYVTPRTGTVTIQTKQLDRQTAQKFRYV